MNPYEGIMGNEGEMKEGGRLEDKRRKEHGGSENMSGMDYKTRHGVIK